MIPDLTTPPTWPAVAERLGEGTLTPIEDLGPYGVIVGITHRGHVDLLVRNWPLEPCARKLREAAEQLDAAATAESAEIAAEAQFDQHLDAMAGGAW